MTSSLVGSEMCIRDRYNVPLSRWRSDDDDDPPHERQSRSRDDPQIPVPVSYTHLTLPTICSV
eukprot:3786702-Prorocentrum_lima.AAC.1